MCHFVRLVVVVVVVLEETKVVAFPDALALVGSVVSAAKRGNEYSWTSLVYGNYNLNVCYTLTFFQISL